MKKQTRRAFLKHIGTSISAVALRWVAPGLLMGGIAGCQTDQDLSTPVVSTIAADTPASLVPTQAPTETSMPAPSRTPAPLPSPTINVAKPLDVGPRVVHIHSESATLWSGQVNYWEHTDQGVVSQMVDRGMIELTGQSTVADAWRALIPGYQPGKGIAIKVNFNNTLDGGCGDARPEINALPQPVAAVIAGLKAMGVDENDLWIYDGVNRMIPDYFTASIPYRGVQYFDRCHNPIDYYSSQDSSVLVNFNPPPDVPSPGPQRVADVLARASYLINMPILKSHGCASLTLGFKNHFGSIDDPGGLHNYIFSVAGCGGAPYPQYSPLVDLYRNPHIGAKTVLTIGDGLFGSKEGHDARPTNWSTFQGNVPNSLFFAVDPVAIDSVMADFVRSERGAARIAGADGYLQFAEDAGLGLFERGDPWKQSYKNINFRSLEI